MKHDGKHILEFSANSPPCLSSPCLSSPLIPSFSGIYICQVKNFFIIKSQYEMLKLTFSAQGSRVIIVPSCTGAVKLYVAALEAVRKNERQHETEFTTKIARKTALVPVISFCTIFFHSWESSVGRVGLFLGITWNPP
jgi:hypothetical protein